MMIYLKEYFLALIIFLGIDAIWLTVLSRKLYAEKLGYIMTDKVNFLAALLFYLLFIAALVFFVIHGAVINQSVMQAVLAGAFFGLACYATYDLTNLATIKDWPVIITVIDLIWGTAISAAVSGLTVFILKAVSK